LDEKVQHNLESTFTCKHEGLLTEYGGSKVMLSHDANGLGTVKFAQLVLICKLGEEYHPPDGLASKLRAVTSQVLVNGKGDSAVNASQAKM